MFLLLGNHGYHGNSQFFQQISDYFSLLCILIISYFCQIYFDENIDDYMFLLLGNHARSMEIVNFFNKLAIISHCYAYL